VLRAYHTLRAVPVPAGSHTVRMVYRWSAVVLWSFAVSMAMITLLLIALAWSGFAHRRARVSSARPA
jgi:hypothetical protein